MKIENIVQGRSSKIFNFLVLLLPLSKPVLSQEPVQSIATNDNGNVQEQIESRSDEQYVRELMSRILEARRISPGDPDAALRQPGVDRLRGLEAPETEAIRALLHNLNLHSSEISMTAMAEVQLAKERLGTSQYAVFEVANLCRFLLSLNGHYESKAEISKSIAEQLVKLDLLEAEKIRRIFNQLLANLSAPGRDFITREKEWVHSNLSVSKQDWLYLSEKNPDFLIERRVEFCSRI